MEKPKEGLSEFKNSFNGTNSLEGARVGIIAKPSAEFVAGMWATWISGAVAVPLALSYPQAELLHVINDAVCVGLFIHICYFIMHNNIV